MPEEGTGPAPVQAGATRPKREEWWEKSGSAGGYGAGVWSSAQGQEGPCSGFIVAAASSRILTVAPRALDRGRAG